MALVTRAEDTAKALADSIAPKPARAISPPPASATSTAVKDGESGSALLSALGLVPVTVDELARRCHLSSVVVAAMLMNLELAGRVERHPGQRVSLISR